MFILKRVFRFFLWFLGVIVSWIVICLILSYIPYEKSVGNGEASRTIYISTNGVHVDIIIPVEELSDADSVKLNFPYEASFLSFGWGNKEFYTKTKNWSDLTAGRACRALFTASESAMHVTGYKNIYNHWIEIKLNEDQFDTIQSRLRQAFQADDRSYLKLTEPGYGNTDLFYAANGSYSLIRTCNSWVNGVLKDAGVRTSLWTPFDFPIMYHARKN